MVVPFDINQNRQNRNYDFVGDYIDYNNSRMLAVDHFYPESYRFGYDGGVYCQQYSATTPFLENSCYSNGSVQTIHPYRPTPNHHQQQQQQQQHHIQQQLAQQQQQQHNNQQHDPWFYPGMAASTFYSNNNNNNNKPAFKEEMIPPQTDITTCAAMVTVTPSCTPTSSMTPESPTFSTVDYPMTMEYDGRMLYDHPSPSSDSSECSADDRNKQNYTMELDVMCRICGDRASGFHYGVHSCEGCKGFFRRTLRKRLVYKPCLKGIRCKIDPGTRNKCQYCRFQKCIEAGMSHDAVRFGRMPKTEREKLLMDREEMRSTCSERVLEIRSLADTVKSAFREHFPNLMSFIHHQVRVKAEPSECMHSDPEQQQQPSTSSYMPVPLESPAMINWIDDQTFAQLEIFRHFQELMIPSIEATAKFGKRIPGFSDLTMADQILLLKHAGFEIGTVMLHSLVDKRGITLPSQGKQLLLMRSAIGMCKETAALLENAISLVDKVNSMELIGRELALFCAILLITTDREGLQNPEKVEEMQTRLVDALRFELKRNHPKRANLFGKLLLTIPDLRQIAHEFTENVHHHKFDKSDDFTSVLPLFREILDFE